MTVQELIDKLMLIEDKGTSILVEVETDLGVWQYDIQRTEETTDQLRAERAYCIVCNDSI